MKPLKWILRKLMLIVVGIMIGVSNVIYEEDQMIGTMGSQIENPSDPEDQLNDPFG